MMDNEKLISLVSNYPELYDLENANYMNQERKNNIWNEISTILDVTDTLCKEKWKALRDAYHRSIKRRKTKSGDGAKKIKKWRYESQMEFLRPHFQERNSKTNIENTNTSDDDFELANSPSSTSVYLPRPNSRAISTPDLEIPGSSRESSTPDLETPRPPSQHAIFKNITARKKNQKSHSAVANVLQKYLSSRPTSSTVESITPVHSFFKAMADTVAALPTDLQIKVKSQVYSIVSQAETENLRQTSALAVSSASGQQTTDDDIQFIPVVPENLRPTTAASQQLLTDDETRFVPAVSENLRPTTAASEQLPRDDVSECILEPSQSILQQESQLRYSYFIGPDGQLTYKLKK